MKPKPDGGARIVQAGDPVLRQVARPLTPAELRSTEIRRLIDLMRRTMHAAPGVGLAAPQIGIGLQLAVIEDKREYMKDAPEDFLRERERSPVPFQVIANPVLTEVEGGKREFFEGCLSLAGFTAVVPRARQVRVEFLDERAQPRTLEATGWYARILQHEIDHLQGTLYVDRMKTRSFMSVENFDAEYKQLRMDEIRRIIGW